MHTDNNDNTFVNNEEVPSPVVHVHVHIHVVSVLGCTVERVLIYVYVLSHSNIIIIIVQCILFCHPEWHQAPHLVIAKK